MQAAGTTTFREWRHFALVQELALAAAAALTYFGVRNLTAGAAAEAMSNADRLAHLERRLHVAWERSLQDALLDHDLFVTLVNWIYIWGHWPVIITAAIVLYRKRHGPLPAAPQRDLRLRGHRLPVLRAATGGAARVSWIPRCWTP